MSGVTIPEVVLTEFEEDLRAAQGNDTRIQTAKTKARVLIQTTYREWNYETRRAVEAELDRIADEILGRNTK